MDVDFTSIAVRVEAPFAYVVLNRPQIRNALNRTMVKELRRFFASIYDDRDIRAVVLTGAGSAFCAGEDIKELQSIYTDPHHTNRERVEDFDVMLRAINSAPQVVIARVQGEASGTGVGLVCVSDVAIAAEDTIFTIPDVRLGIVPALIAPYLLQRVGLTAARRLILTGARIDGTEAVRIGLIHEAGMSPDDMDDRVRYAMEDVRQGSPAALAESKRLLFEILDKELDATAAHRATILDNLQRSKEGQEGMLAYIRKRKPKWARYD